MFVLKDSANNIKGTARQIIDLVYFVSLDKVKSKLEFNLIRGQIE